MATNQEGNNTINPDELGLGEKFTGTKNGRLLDADGNFNVVRKGISKYSFYEKMINASPIVMGLILFLYFVVINLFFGLLYACLGAGAFSGLDYAATFGKRFYELFFFSVHTLTTIGYGNYYPITTIAHELVMIESFVGMLTVAIATGIVFVRYSKAKVYIKQSDKMVIAPFKDGKALMFRIVNATNTTLINVEANITATWLEKEGEATARKFQRLHLELSMIYMLPLNWTLVHRINEESPVCLKSKEERKNEMLEFIVMIKAYDPLYCEQVFKNFSYSGQDIIEDAKYVRMYHFSENEGTILDINKISDIEKA